MTRFVSNTVQRPWLLYLVLGAITIGVYFLLPEVVQGIFYNSSVPLW